MKFSDYLNGATATTADPKHFRTACALHSPGSYMPTAFVHDAYTAWARAAGGQPMPRRALVAALREMGMYARRGGRVGVFDWRLRDPAELRALGLDADRDPLA